MKLTETQTKIANEILSSLEGASQKLIFVRGLSGVGKSTLLQQISKDIQMRNGKIIEYERSARYFIKHLASETGHVITPITVNEIDRFPTEQIPVNYVPSAVILPGMNLPEIKTFISEMGIIKAKLTLEELANTSFGVPFLTRILSHQRIGRDEAAIIAEDYLRTNILNLELKDQVGTYLNEYLQIKPSTQIIERANQRKYPRTSPYDNLFWFLNEHKAMEKEGICEPSPIFIASESDRIYERMMNSGSKDPYFALYASQLTDEQATQIRKSFGLTEKEQYLNRDSPRVRLFLLDNWFAKTAMQVMHNNVAYNMTEMADRKEIVDLEIGHFLEETKMQKTAGNSFYYRKHDHSLSDISANTWMAESLLQQIGAAYTAFNRASKQMYAYHPEEKSIKIIKNLKN
jgi:hypothetical protein